MKKILIFIMILCMSVLSVYAEESADIPQITEEKTDTEIPSEDSGEITPEEDSQETEPSGEEEKSEDILPEGDSGNTPGDDEIQPPSPEEEPLPEADFSDDMENSLKMLKTSDNIIFETVPEIQYSEFYEDYTIAQRTVKSEEYIIYDLPYWKSASLTAYFYNNEEINHFMIYASADNEEYTEITAETDTESAEGKWHKVTYKFEKSDIKQRYIKIVWQDLTETAFTNWGQALGDIKVYSENVVVNEIKYLSAELFALPDSGEAAYNLEAAAVDQMGEALEDKAVVWQEFSDEKVSLTAEGILTVGASEEETAEYTFTATVPGTEISLTVNIKLTHYPPGDINSDFKITAEDLSLAGKSFMRPPEDDGIRRGDINKNGKIDIYDLAYISYNMEEEIKK